jgi:hypothetical protein
MNLVIECIRKSKFSLQLIVGDDEERSKRFGQWTESTRPATFRSIGQLIIPVFCLFVRRWWSDLMTYITSDVLVRKREFPIASTVLVSCRCRDLELINSVKMTQRIDTGRIPYKLLICSEPVCNSGPTFAYQSRPLGFCSRNSTWNCCFTTCRKILIRRPIVMDSTNYAHACHFCPRETQMRKISIREILQL